VENIIDVTPTQKMFEAMQMATDAICGEAPLAIEQSAAANKRRDQRATMMNFMHRLVHLSMREGAARAMNPSRTSLGKIDTTLPRSLRG
jgi:hypothetical protein